MQILISSGSKNFKTNLMSILENKGYSVFLMENENDDIPVDLETVEIIICNNLLNYHPHQKFTNLKIIQTTSAGLDRLPIDELKQRGVIIRNAAGVYSIPMAEYVVSSILNIYRHNFDYKKQQENSVWFKQRNLIELAHKKVCILGCGNVGMECAKRLKSFDCSVIGIDRRNIGNEYFDCVYPLSHFEKIVGSFDVVISSLPLTDDTKYLFSKNIFKKMKKNAIFINVSRGALVNEKDLIEHLETNKEFFAVLDVFEKEPLSSDNELWNLQNVIITPHISFIGDGNDNRLIERILINFEELLNE